MAPVGYCNECGDTVSLTDTGECQHGHPAASIVEGREEVPTPTPGPVSERDRAQSRRTLRIVLAVIASVTAVYMIAGAGLAWFVMSGRLAVLASEATPELRSMLAEDYPGWKIVDVRSFDLEQPNGFVEKNYLVTATPPGEGFSVGVLYHIDEEGRLVSDDSVFRHGALLEKRAPALLEFLRASYIDQDMRIVWVDSGGSGPVYLNYEYVHPNGPATQPNGGIHTVIFDSDSNVWRRGN